ncbi:MAG: peptide-methionine (S)-S-oxide reductase MsrA [Rhodovarius sp.]|nr:peptide-methionine (S)-S-oxide reductase MsrA [Rhodovarius sp.]MCX7933532.1 peptide-methionine (S)-S-oxide reductase MsrA [Rhodovarius sp.]
MTPTPAAETAILGGGCFWCLDAVFRELDGVIESECGYAGGHLPNPTYEQVCSKTTGHAEVVRVTFDPAILPYADLLRVFFAIHDPTTKDRQGADVGPQYRSIIIALDPRQEETARAVMQEVATSGLWGAPPVTEILGPVPFYPAEAYHQDYFARNPWQPYCRVVIAPKVAKFRKAFAHRLRRASA